MTPDDVRKRTRAHLIAFVIVLALALMSAGSVLAGQANVAAVLAIAAVQVLVVVFAMMHAGQDGPWVRWTLGLCVVFVAALAGLTLFGQRDTIDGTEHVVVAPVEAAAEH